MLWSGFTQHKNECVFITSSICGTRTSFFFCRFTLLHGRRRRRTFNRWSKSTMREWDFGLHWDATCSMQLRWKSTIKKSMRPIIKLARDGTIEPLRGKLMTKLDLQLKLHRELLGTFSRLCNWPIKSRWKISLTGELWSSGKKEKKKSFSS